MVNSSGANQFIGSLSGIFVSQLVSIKKKSRVDYISNHLFIFIWIHLFWASIYLWIIVVHIWRRKWQPTPVFLPGESHGQRSLEGCSPWGLKESNTTERLTRMQWYIVKQILLCLYIRLAFESYSKLLNPLGTTFQRWIEVHLIFTVFSEFLLFCWTLLLLASLTLVSVKPPLLTGINSQESLLKSSCLGTWIPKKASRQKVVKTKQNRTPL